MVFVHLEENLKSFLRLTMSFLPERFYTYTCANWHTCPAISHFQITSVFWYALFLFVNYWRLLLSRNMLTYRKHWYHICVWIEENTRKAWFLSLIRHNYNISSWMHLCKETRKTFQLEVYGVLAVINWHRDRLFALCYINKQHLI